MGIASNSWANTLSEGFLKIASGVDISQLKLELKRHPDIWDRNTARKDHPDSPHRQMKDIWVRYSATPELHGPHISEWYDESYQIPSVRKIALQLMSFVEGEQLGGILITRLPPGGRIEPHTDKGWHAEFYEKYYIPVHNKEGAKFCFGDGEINPEEGDVYWFDNSLTHWVENNSTEDRIAMIVCIHSHRYEDRV